MDWVKLATRYYHDPKITGLPDADTELMFVRGLARAGEVGRGGFIPETDLPLLARRRRYAACVDALIVSGLWSRVPGGYQVNAWADWQDALDVLARRRTADRERKRAHRLEQRRALARKYGDHCRRCGTNENLVIDHIVPLSRGGTDDDDNKQLLCWSCNAQKRNLTEEEYDVWMAETGSRPSLAPPSKANAGVTLSADMSADVRRAELEEEVDLPKGGTTTNEPRAGPPPRRCPEHQSTDQPPPCGACRDARIAYDAWHATNGNGSAPPPLPPVEQVIDRETEPDPHRNVDAIHRIRELHPLAKRPQEPQ